MCRKNQMKLNALLYRKEKYVYSNHEMSNEMKN